MLLQSQPASDVLIILGVTAVLFVLAGFFILVAKFIQQPGQKQDEDEQGKTDT